MGELTPPRGTNELAGLVHLPHKSIASPILMRSTQRLKTVADFMTKPEGICLGVNEHYDTTKDVYLPENENGGAKLDHRAANRSCFWAE